MLKFQAITIIVRFQVTTIIMKSPGERACGTPYIAQADGMSVLVIYGIFALTEGVYAVHHQQHFCKILRLPS